MRWVYSDLKQVVVSLICTYQSSIPVWLETLSGNSSDKTSFPKTIKAYVYFIADSALYSAENLARLEHVYWISRVPETVKAVEECYAQCSKEQMQPSAQAGYYFKEVASDYVRKPHQRQRLIVRKAHQRQRLMGGVPQRWLVVFSEAAYNREEDVHQAIAKERAKWRFHRVDYQLEEVPHYAKPGRPAQDTTPDQIGYRLVGCVVEDREAIAQALQP